MDVPVWLFVMLILGWPIAVVAAFVAWRFFKKADSMDEVFQYLAEDIVTNIMQFGKMARLNVMMDDPEIQAAHRNMMTMGMRLEEILKRIEEETGLRLRPPPPQPRPKVV